MVPHEDADPHRSDGSTDRPGPDVDPTGALEIVGFTDGVDEKGRITGWCYIPQYPDHRVALTAFVDDVEVSSGIAADHRSDVREAGFGDGNSGYALHLPASCFDGALHRLVVRGQALGASIDMRMAIELALRTPDIPEPIPGRWRFSTIANPAQPNTADVPLSAYVPGQYIQCFSPDPAPPTT